MKAALSLMDVANLTWPKVPGKGSATFADYCKFLYNQKEDIWIISRDGNLDGMIAARNTAGRLYVTMFVTLSKDAFVEFTNRLKEKYGEIRTVAYLRRGKPKEISFNRLQQLANIWTH